jgi:hypothetical protein
MSASSTLQIFPGMNPAGTWTFLIGANLWALDYGQWI